MNVDAESSDQCEEAGCRRWEIYYRCVSKCVRFTLCGAGGKRGRTLGGEKGETCKWVDTFIYTEFLIANNTCESGLVDAIRNGHHSREFFAFKCAGRLAMQNEEGKEKYFIQALLNVSLLFLRVSSRSMEEIFLNSPNNDGPFRRS